MARFDGNRDLLAVENEALQAQLEEAAAQIVEQNRQVAELQARIAADEEIQNQLDDALLRIDDRDQQIARLRAVNPNFVNPNVDVETILKGLQTPQILRDFPCFTGDPVKLHSFIKSIDKLMPTLERARGTPAFDVWMHAIRSKITHEADAALELYGTETNWEDIKSTLITHFSDKRDEISLTRDLFKLKQGDSIETFYRDVSHYISLLINLLHLNENVAVIITAKKQFYQDLGLKVFLSGLKEPLGPIIRAQAPKTLKEALRLCLEEDNYNYVKSPFQSVPKPSIPISLPPKPMMKQFPMLPPKPFHYPRQPFQQSRPFQFNSRPFQFNPVQKPFHFQPTQRPFQFNPMQRSFQPNQLQRPFQFNPQNYKNPFIANMFNKNAATNQPKPTPMEVDPSVRTRQVNYMNRPNYQVEESLEPTVNDYDYDHEFYQMYLNQLYEQTGQQMNELSGQQMYEQFNPSEFPEYSEYQETNNSNVQSQENHNEPKPIQTENQNNNVDNLNFHVQTVTGHIT